jgi:gas vesicle protein/phage tail protein X
MGQDPDMIRRDIEDTRERMGDTVDALGYKTDVKARAGDKVGALKEKVTGATPSTDDVKGGAKQAVGVAQENPLGLAIGAVAIGFLAGMLIPSTKVENERIGPMADQVKDQIKDTGAEALEHGKAVASETASAAVDAAKSTAQEEGQAHAEDLKDTARDNAETARQGAAQT